MTVYVHSTHLLFVELTGYQKLMQELSEEEGRVLYLLTQ